MVISIVQIVDDPVKSRRKPWFRLWWRDASRRLQRDPRSVPLIARVSRAKPARAEERGRTQFVPAAAEVAARSRPERDRWILYETINC